MSTKQYLGLDVGSAATKAVVLDNKGNIVGVDSLNMREEGILNDTEMYASIAEWLSREGWQKSVVAAAIPQYMTTILARNYPEKLPSKALKMQLEAEANQVAGLSDEPMLQDCCILGKTSLRTNSVIIAISREKNIRERLDAISAARINATSIVPGGIALANAFYHLHPELRDSNAPILLLECGNENTTALVLAGGQPLFMSSLMFSSDKINDIVKRRGAEYKLAVQELDMRTINVGELNSHSSAMEALFAFENEIHAFLDSWRTQETEDLSQATIDNVYVCGGLSQMKGLIPWLQERLEVNVSMLAPQYNNVPHPELTQAYGLALQSAQISRLTISLLPSDVRSAQLRKKYWPLLAASIALFIITFALIDLHSYNNMRLNIKQLNKQKDELKSCENVINQILDAQTQLKQQEAQMLPLIAAGNQSKHIRELLDSMASSTAPQDWFIYLADEKTYQESRPVNNTPMQNKAQRKAKVSDLFSQQSSNAIGDTADRAEFPTCLTSANIHSTTSYIAAGYTPHYSQEPFKPVRDILDKLDKTNIYAKPDLLPEVERIGREDIFKPWVDFLKRVKGQYKAFTIRLPLKTPDINNSPSPENDEE